MPSRWNDVDWTKSNREVAADMGVSRERAKQVRRQLGMPAHEDPTVQRMHERRDYLRQLYDSDTLHTYSRQQLADMFGVRRIVINRDLRILGLQNAIEVGPQPSLFENLKEQEP